MSPAPLRRHAWSCLVRAPLSFLDLEIPVVVSYFPRAPTPHPLSGRLVSTPAFLELQTWLPSPFFPLGPFCLLRHPVFHLCRATSVFTDSMPCRSVWPHMLQPETWLTCFLSSGSLPTGNNLSNFGFCLRWSKNIVTTEIRTPDAIASIKM